MRTCALFLWIYFCFSFKHFCTLFLYCPSISNFLEDTPPLMFGIFIRLVGLVKLLLPGGVFEMISMLFLLNFVVATVKRYTLRSLVNFFNLRWFYSLCYHFPKCPFLKTLVTLLVYFPPFIIIMLGNFYFIKLRLYISLFIHHLDKWIRFGNTIYSFLLKRKGREGWNSRGGGEVWKITWVNILKAWVGLNFSQNLIAGGGWIRMTWLEKIWKII